MDGITGLQSGRRKDLGHFWVTKNLCFKTRAMAKPSKWKYYDFLFSSLANKTPFSKKGFALWNLGLWNSTEMAFLLLFKYPGVECPGYTSKGDLHSLLVLWLFLASLGPWDTQWKRVYQRIFVKHAHFFFRLLEIGFRWGKTIHRGRAWTINLQTIGSTRGGTRSHIKVTGILVGQFKLRDRA